MGNYYVAIVSAEDLKSDFRLIGRRDGWEHGEELVTGYIQTMGQLAKVSIEPSGYWRLSTTYMLEWVVEDFVLPSGQWVDDFQTALEMIVDHASEALQIPNTYRYPDEI